MIPLHLLNGILNRSFTEVKFNNVISFIQRYMNDCYSGSVIFVLIRLRLHPPKRYFINNIGCETN